jgi:hypothetical protein
MNPQLDRGDPQQGIREAELVFIAAYEASRKTRSPFEKDQIELGLPP